VSYHFNTCRRWFAAIVEAFSEKENFWKKNLDGSICCSKTCLCHSALVVQVINAMCTNVPHKISCMLKDFQKEWKILNLTTGQFSTLKKILTQRKCVRSHFCFLCRDWPFVDLCICGCSNKLIELYDVFRSATEPILFLTVFPKRPEDYNILTTVYIIDNEISQFFSSVNRESLFLFKYLPILLFTVCWTPLLLYF